MSETMRIDWDRVYLMPVIEFLNVICYIKDKTEDDKRELEKWKKNN